MINTINIQEIAKIAVDPIRYVKNYDNGFHIKMWGEEIVKIVKLLNLGNSTLCMARTGRDYYFPIVIDVRGTAHVPAGGGPVKISEESLITLLKRSGITAHRVE